MNKTQVSKTNKLTEKICFSKFLDLSTILQNPSFDL